MLEEKVCKKCASLDTNKYDDIYRKVGGTFVTYRLCSNCDQPRQAILRKEEAIYVNRPKAKIRAWDSKKSKEWNDRARESRLRIIERLGV